MQKVTWNQRKALLEKALAKPINNDRFFEQHKACVLSIRRTPKWEQTRQLLDLDLTEFQDACGGDIFPKKAFCTFTSSPSLRTFVPKDLKITMKSDWMTVLSQSVKNKAGNAANTWSSASSPKPTILISGTFFTSYYALHTISSSITLSFIRIRKQKNE